MENTENKANNIISVKVMCLIIDQQRILAGKGYDSVKGEKFYRVLGGGLNFGETSEQGIRREIKEELGCEIENLKMLDVIENIFTYEGEPGHEITFLFKGDLTDKNLYQQDVIHIVEADYELEAEWILTKDILEEKIKLYPQYDYSKLVNLL